MVECINSTCEEPKRQIPVLYRRNEKWFPDAYEIIFLVSFMNRRLHAQKSPLIKIKWPASPIMFVYPLSQDKSLESWSITPSSLKCSLLLFLSEGEFCGGSFDGFPSCSTMQQVNLTMDLMELRDRNSFQFAIIIKSTIVTFQARTTMKIHHHLLRARCQLLLRNR